MSLRKKKMRGFTLLEMLVTVVIVGLVLVGVTSFLKNSADVSAVQNDEFYFQSDMRDSMRIIDYTIKKSSAVFTVPDRMFNDPAKRDEDWSYIGVPVDGGNKGKVCILKYDGKIQNWVESPITKNTDDIMYSIEFEKPANTGDEQKLLSYKLSGQPMKNGTKTRKAKTLETETEVLSASMVGNKSKPTEISIALAFRDGKKDNPKRASLTVVVDVSNSMKDIMDGGKSRMQILKEALKKLMDGLNATSSGEINLSVCIIDYSYYATILGEEESNLGFYELAKEKDKVDHLIDDVSYDRDVKFSYYSNMAGYYVLSKRGRWGATNTADGLRLAYHVIDDYVKFNGGHGDDPNYLILFMDGAPTAHTFLSGGAYYYGDKRFDNYVAFQEDGKGYLNSILSRSIWCNCDPNVPSTFTEAQKATIETIKKLNPKFANLQSFLVAVGASDADRQKSCAAINTAMNGNANYYEAEKPDQLDKAIVDIRDKISFNFWHVNGPREK